MQLLFVTNTTRGMCFEYAMPLWHLLSRAPNTLVAPACDRRAGMESANATLKAHVYCDHLPQAMIASVPRAHTTGEQVGM